MIGKLSTIDPLFAAAAGPVLSLSKQCRRWKETATYQNNLRIELVDGLQPVF